MSIVFGAIFVLWEMYLERRCTLQPVIKPSLFTRHDYKISAILLSAFFCCSSVYGWTYTTSIFYQNVKHYTPLKNAVHVLPANIMGLIAAVSGFEQGIRQS